MPYFYGETFRRGGKRARKGGSSQVFLSAPSPILVQKSRFVYLALVVAGPQTPSATKGS